MSKRVTLGVQKPSGPTEPLREDEFPWLERHQRQAIDLARACSAEVRFVSILFSPTLFQVNRKREDAKDMAEDVLRALDELLKRERQYEEAAGTKKKKDQIADDADALKQIRIRIQTNQLAFTHWMIIVSSSLQSKRNQEAGGSEQGFNLICVSLSSLLCFFRIPIIDSSSKRVSQIQPRCKARRRPTPREPSRSGSLAWM